MAAIKFEFCIYLYTATVRRISEASSAGFGCVAPVPIRMTTILRHVCYKDDIRAWRNCRDVLMVLGWPAITVYGTLGKMADDASLIRPTLATLAKNDFSHN
jgi:hypothetical protein